MQVGSSGNVSQVDSEHQCWAVGARLSLWAGWRTVGLLVQAAMVDKVDRKSTSGTSIVLYRKMPGLASCSSKSSLTSLSKGTARLFRFSKPSLDMRQETF